MFTIVLSFIAFFPDVALAQSKFFSTPTRGGNDAREQAVLQSMLSESQRANTCTSRGLIYAPTHASADADGCTASADGRVYAGNVSVGADISASGTVQIGGASVVCNASREGAIRYNSGTHKMEFCDSTSWKSMGFNISACTIRSNVTTTAAVDGRDVANVFCQNGETVMGGGCSHGSPFNLRVSYPGNNGWHCQWLSANNDIKTAYATCCPVN